MTAAGWVMFVLAHLAILLLIGVSVLLVWADEAPGWLLFGVAGVALDVLVLTGVIGSGLPLSTKASTELLIAVIGIFALGMVAEGMTFPDTSMLVGGVVGVLLVVPAEALLLSGTLWHEGRSAPAAASSSPAPTRRPTAAPGPTVTVEVTVPVATVTVTRKVTVTKTVAQSGSPSGQMPSGTQAFWIALGTLAGGLFAGVGGLLTGWASFRHSRRGHQPPGPPGPW
ncbi:hypothetical protein ABGB12_34810 [Actinocorallia sp. B10E7]|uniref:hypothetical protein n=1 Tax=Actinocorallia sp. B10E7 TaxID=3153558 RepID=UPI00325E4F52